MNRNRTDESRESVVAARDQATGETFLRGTETSSRDRANVFGVWRENKNDPDGLDGSGHYKPAQSGSEIGVEVEVRFAFADLEDIDDHAEVYLWQIYYWALTSQGPHYQKDLTFGGEYVVEAGGLDGPFSIFSPLVEEGVKRIQQARYNGKVLAPRMVGNWGQ